MVLYFITGSKNKFAEVQALLPHVEQMEMDLDEIQELDAHKIIAAKLFQARAALRHGSAVLVEDTSLYLAGMNGLPGPLNKWFLKALGNEGLCRLAGVFGSEASARTIIGYADERGRVEFFEGEVEGTMVSPRGESGFGWDAIFMPKGHDKTFAEMSADEKNAVSMRRMAVEKLKKRLN